jgi:phosphatidylserine/phosphatidylglycerophosphate/cardiolipin synthase-like enzyme
MARRRKPQRSRSMFDPGRIAIVLIIIALIAIGYLYEQNAAPPTSEAPAQPTAAPRRTAPPGGTSASGGLIQVYFTTPSIVYPDVPAQRRQPPLLQAVIADLNAAQRSIDIAVFDFDLDDLADALIAARGRGVQVRMVIDSENLEDAKVSKVAGRLEQGGVPIAMDDREAFMHNKFIVIDQRIAWTGSWNMTINDTYRNNNNFIRMSSQLAAAAYRQEFEQMFDGTFGPRKSVFQRPQIRLDDAPLDIFFSPEDGVAQHVLEQINNAQGSIRVMAFSFTSSEIADAIIERQAAGVVVQVVMERQNASGTGAVFGRLESGGVNVLEDGSCYILHHKAMIIDDQIVITGSYNFTNSAERSNDENLVIVSDPALARAFVEEFDRIYAQAQSPTRCG